MSRTALPIIALLAAATGAHADPSCPDLNGRWVHREGPATWRVSIDRFDCRSLVYNGRRHVIGEPALDVSHDGKVVQWAVFEYVPDEGHLFIVRSTADRALASSSIERLALAGDALVTTRQGYTNVLRDGAPLFPAPCEADEVIYQRETPAQR
jgi:hypothetical protein